MWVLRRLNSTEYCATGDSIGIIPAILYIVANVSESTKGATSIRDDEKRDPTIFNTNIFKTNIMGAAPARLVTQPVEVHSQEVRIRTVPTSLTVE
jgi:hypothetical protein